MTLLAAPDDLDRLGATVAAMSLRKRLAWMATLEDDELDEVEQALARRADPTGAGVYRTLGYEPICIPRVKAALAAGHANPIEAEEAGMTDLPEPCGECPAERFEAAAAFEVLFGGAAGGSKTKSSLMFAIRCMARWPGFRALLLRETYDELDENVYPELRAIDYAEDIGGRWNAGRRQLDIGDSSMRFRYMHDLDDIRRRRGGSYQLIVLDEANQLPAGTVDALRDRLRSANPRIPVVGFRLTANPGGRSHGELKKNYVTATDHGAHPIVVRSPTGATHERVFIPARAPDNPYLGDDYFETVLGAIEDPVLRAAMRDGDWDKFSGQFFGEWQHERHVVPRGSYQLLPEWPRHEGIDYGRAAPWCMLRGAFDGDGRLWLYRELYKTGLGETEQAKLIVADEERWGDRDSVRAGDPAMWNRVQEAPSIADTYAKQGVKMEKANNDRTVGWARVHTYLAEAEPCPYHAALGWASCPLLHVFEGTCPNFVRTLPDLPFSKTKLEDLDTDAEDHAADAFRYLVMSAKPPRRRHRLSGQAQREMAAASV